jgi:ABC-2 type transport system permease protein
VTAAVLRKELVTLWASSLPFAVGAAFHLALGILMVDQLQVRAQAVIQPLFPIAGFLLLFAVPVLTMRAFAEEARTGTLDLLLAIPVPSRPLVLGKWLAAWLTTLVVLLPAALIVLLVAAWGEPDAGPAVSGFVGLAVLAATLAGIGVLASSLTSSQPVSAMLAMSVVLVLWFAQAGPAAESSGGLWSALSLSERLRTFAGGGISTGDVGYLACIAAGCLIAAALAVDLRRLR